MSIAANTSSSIVLEEIRDADDEFQHHSFLDEKVLKVFVVRQVWDKRV